MEKNGWEIIEVKSPVQSIDFSADTYINTMLHTFLQSIIIANCLILAKSYKNNMAYLRFVIFFVDGQWYLKW